MVSQGPGLIADNIFLLDISPTAIAGLALLVTELIPSLRTYIRSKPGQEVGCCFYLFADYKVKV